MPAGVPIRLVPRIPIGRDNENPPPATESASYRRRANHRSRDEIAEGASLDREDLGQLVGSGLAIADGDGADVDANRDATGVGLGADVGAGGAVGVANGSGNTRDKQRHGASEQ